MTVNCKVYCCSIFCEVLFFSHWTHLCEPRGDNQRGYLFKMLCRHAGQLYHMIRRVKCGVRSQFSRFLCQNVKMFPKITPAEWEEMGRYEAELLQWNEKINLISRKDAAEEGKIMNNHILPCLCIGLVRPFLTGESILDAGSVPFSLSIYAIYS